MRSRKPTNGFEGGAMISLRDITRILVCDRFDQYVQTGRHGIANLHAYL